MLPKNLVKLCGAVADITGERHSARVLPGPAVEKLQEMVGDRGQPPWLPTKPA